MMSAVNSSHSELLSAFVAACEPGWRAIVNLSSRSPDWAAGVEIYSASKGAIKV